MDTLQMSVLLLFKQQVLFRPDAIAVTFEDISLTYVGLNKQANRLAHYLQRQGIGPESLVGIAIERSPDMLIALLAVLKTGAAYVPLDPTYPSERLSLMLHDAHISLLLTHQYLTAQLPASSLPLLSLDLTRPAIADEPSEDLSLMISPHNLAYIIYTSGSTGQPKGVQITHGGLYALASTQQEIFAIQPQDRILQFASLSFDASVFEICLALMAGATLALATREALLPGKNLQCVLEQYAITHATLPPSVLASLTSDQLPCLHTVISAGELLSRGLANQLVKTHRLYNAYGPTEATVWATGAYYTSYTSAQDQPPLIGPAINHVQTHVLNEQLQPVPIGASGELYLGGPGIARGYRNQAALTAERFIPDPFSKEAGTRLYKTGDLVRVHADGALEFLGRLDHQVKIRGFRIEPDEIQLLLNTHPSVQQSLVVAQKDASGYQSLTAYVIPHPENASDKDALRAYLQQRLPDYMLPSRFTFLQAFPLTPNGKIDRHMLIQPTALDQLPETDLEGSCTSIEKNLLALWTQLLGVVHIGVHDSFFTIGGHSLIAAQMTARIYDLFQIEVPLQIFFALPTIAKMARYIEETLHNKTQVSLPPITKRPHTHTAPLSFTQQRLWFLDQLEVARPAYIVPVALHLRGSLQLAVLNKSINHIMQRHEILRTAFPDDRGQAFQSIAPYRPIIPLMIELSTQDGTEKKQQVQQIITQEIHRPFDLAHGPLLRVMLLRLDDHEHILLLTMHHIITDDWSIDIFLHEFTSFYSSFVLNKEPHLPELSVQYADVAHWQQAYHQQEKFTEQSSYWKQQLQGLPPVLTLPGERSRPPIPSFQGASLPFLLSPQTSQRVRALAQREQVTVFMVLLAAFQTLLYRYSDQRDIAVGTPIAHRFRTELEPLLGFFANTLVIRTHPAADMPFLDFLHHVRNIILEAYAHQDLPFEQLVELLQPQRSLSHNPLFQIMFLFQNQTLHLDKPTIPELEVRQLEVHTETIQCDLQLEMIETPHGISGVFRYAVDLFEASTITYMVAHFQRLLNTIVVHPTNPLAMLSFLTDEENQAFSTWQTTQISSPPNNQCLHQIIEAQVELTPDAIAVQFEHTTLTYRALNERANQIAHYLQSFGVGPDALVGICMTRSLDMILGLLGIMKAGGAYVPLDPDYPAARLQWMMQEIHAPVLLLQKNVQLSLPDTTITAIYLEDAWETISTYATTNPDVMTHPDNLLYTIYTSGSTGQPKGVMNTHRGLCNRLNWMQETYALTSTDRVLQKTPFSFDVSVWELFWPLLSGACLVIAPPGTQRDCLALFHLITQQCITIVHFVPSMLQACLDTPGMDRCVSLRHVFCSGEALSTHHQLRFFHCLPSTKLHNLYGPTEAAIDVTFWECSQTSELDYIPIGHPIANTHLYILDTQGQIAPVGKPGEIAIAGVGLARGYLNRPDLTAERFLPDPFSDHPNARLYYTGDLACYQANGSIKFLGRIDHQIKLRGFRIEPAEIEATLLTHSLVRECLVLAKEDNDNMPALVAYVVTTSTPPDWIETLRQALKHQLPAYMVPAHFVSLPAFPLTISGKIDRLALPDPSFTITSPPATQALSLTTLEQKLIHLWQEVLHREQVGPHDNFFDLGGHSLLIIRVQRELQQRFKLDVSVLDLFAYPTINALAAFLSSSQQTAPQQFSSLRETPETLEMRETQDTSNEPIAIIGLAGRFPGAKNIAEFWQNLRNGVESISFFTAEELKSAGIDAQTLQSPQYVKANAFIDDIDLFDASFFGYSPREAETIDPQQRLFLECAWEALEHAGYGNTDYRGSVGLFAGVSSSSYLPFYPETHAQSEHFADSFQIQLGNEKDFLATRTSYKLNLRGPAITIQTACSTSLVAVHLACQSLRNNESSLALAGGCSIRIPQTTGYWYQEGGIASPDGHCRAFDAQAQGSVGGDGLGVVVLKRLSAALQDGDTIHAVIRGSAINNDGAAKVSYTAPGLQGQVHVITKALQQAAIDPDTIGYIEAHGTGTPLGDSIEFAALKQAYGSAMTKKNGCALGSVKTNIGHLDAAAGIAGFIKTILILKHREIPASLHFETPNPLIDFAESPFYVNTLLTPWQSTTHQRRAAVSSFGIGGTNAHVILENAPRNRSH
ncbi:hypothetical protein KSD_60800 [Ktedonobacter sp. SOSP1-85]|uniref:non-ribosomal peptide synthetase n=1 Tax=Ktedonobacter sp. SOSP1-85 TaxID=2778367 RepID=UPI0019150712|nr:non-ribosomal peptide synthetase [Ktedonobacter sp. SOSP1-85]GHO78309.1 hypothetical protein KSD_60800 [Ktedonobacter sp. SOSP1-85]